MDSDTLTTPTALLARVREVNRVRIDADLELLQLAVAWADAHPDPDESASAASMRSGRVDAADLDALGAEQHEPDEWRGIPLVAWDAAAGLGTALGRSTAAADRLIQEGLILRHRLPRHWRMVVDGSIEAFRARRVADLVTGCPDDVCAYVDEHVAPVAATAGIRTLDRLLEEAWQTLHADQVELDRLEALDARFVNVDEASINHTGVGDLNARADWADLAAFDQTVSALAAKIAELDAADGLPADCLDVRRARALGVLADPARAQALLEGGPVPRPSRRTDLFLHLSADALVNRTFFGRNGALDRGVVADAIRDWCGRADRNLHVHPVIDLNDHAATDGYEITGTLRTRTELKHPTCVFPWCTRPSRRCDKDHRVPYDEGGASCDCNLAPLRLSHESRVSSTGSRLRDRNQCGRERALCRCGPVAVDAAVGEGVAA